MRVIELTKGEDWPGRYAAEAAELRARLGAVLRDIHHIGSTAIPGILAKPVVDIVIEVNSLAGMEACESELVALGYEAMGEFGIPGRRFYRKGGDARSHHVHAFEPGSFETRRMIAFRDYLRVHRRVARDYEQLKRELAGRFRYSPDEYTEGKTEFVRRVEEEALRWQQSLARALERESIP